MGSLNRNTGHHGKKAQRKGMMALVNRVMQSIGLGDTKVAELLDIKPARVKFNRSKYQPHQGSGECARRVRQGLAGMNLHVVAKPSQSFRYSHWNNAELRMKAQILIAKDSQELGI